SLRNDIVRKPVHVAAAMPDIGRPAAAAHLTGGPRLFEIDDFRLVIGACPVVRFGGVALADDDALVACGAVDHEIAERIGMDALLAQAARKGWRSCAGAKQSGDGCADQYAIEPWHDDRSQRYRRDAGGKPLHTFPHPALETSQPP